MNMSPIPIQSGPIGVKELPNEKLIYLGDTARVPYGTRATIASAVYEKALKKINSKLTVITQPSFKKGGTG